MRSGHIKTGKLITPQNLVRQGLYYNFDYYKKLGAGAFVNEDMIIEKHICTSLIT